MSEFDRSGAIGTMVLAVIAAIGIIPVLANLPLMLELPNEGWNAIHAMHAFDLQLYPPPGGGIVNNYPPFWHYLTGALAHYFGDSIFPGRILALTAYFWTVAAVFFLSCALGARWTSAALGAAWLAAVLAVHFGSQIGNAEPQMLAHAIIVTATAAIVRARSSRPVVIATIALVVAGLFKHTVIALPLAVGAWLLIYRRALFQAFLVAALVTCFTASSGLLALYGEGIVAGLTMPRTLSVTRLATNLAHLGRSIVPIVGFLWLITVVRRFDAAIGFVALAFGGALLEIVLFGAALGVSTNIAFDLMIASALALALSWDRRSALVPGAWQSRLAASFAALLVLRLVLGFSNQTLKFVFDANVRAEQRAQAASLVLLRDRLRAVPDPVACEHLAICVWAGHESALDLWKLRFERTLHPVIDPGEVVRRIGRGDFAAVTLFGRFSGPADDRNLPGLADALSACCGPPVYFGSSTLFLRRGVQ